VRDGTVTPEAAASRVAALSEEDLGFARVDHQRAARCGFPEVVFGQGKSPEQCVAVARAVAARSGRVLVTRCTPDVARALLRALPGARWERAARCVVAEPGGPPPRGGRVVVVSAGTSDLPVAEEARVTAEACGAVVEVLHDCGVAGLHRLLSRADRLRGAAVVVVVAGMEGALASVVGGLVDAPVVAVPTSIGYGASFGGLAALLAMLNSCAAGVAVVNIDNGFGAGFLAGRIARAAATPAPPASAAPSVPRRPPARRPVRSPRRKR
jgi:NCAIR mutase (PurE)-related protein